MKETTLQPFVTYLQGLQDDRGALAALRRGLGQDPSAAPEMYRYVVPWVPQDAEAWREAAYYLLASLFALHPGNATEGNLGAHFARAAAQGSHQAIERRFSTLLAAHPDDLPVYLRQAVGFLKSKGIAINWHQLFEDMLHWNRPNHSVQKAWARAFWGTATAVTTEQA